jgi:tetratricopeptide (TPR) repeat protein
VAWHRERAATTLVSSSEELDDTQQHRLRDLAVGLHDLGLILRDQEQPACVQTFTETYQLARRIDDRQAQAIAAFNLGRAFTEVPELWDLEAAAHWYQDSLDLHDEADGLGRARCINQLGLLHLHRFREAQGADRPEAELLGHLNAAADAYRHALNLTPADAVDDLAIPHHQLGVIYDHGGQLDVALRHWQEAIRYREAAGSRYGAATSRYSVALALAKGGRLGDALLWAQAALRDLQTYGDRAAANVAMTQQLIAAIEQGLAGREG